jgi:hypothetical protein
MPPPLKAAFNVKFEWFDDKMLAETKWRQPALIFHQKNPHLMVFIFKRLNKNCRFCANTCFMRFIENPALLIFSKHSINHFNRPEIRM